MRKETEWEQERQTEKEERDSERWRQREAAVDGRHSSAQTQTWQLVTGDKIKRSCHF